MRKPYLEAGRIVGAHGVRGEMRLEPWCDSPEFLTPLTRLFLDGGGRESLSVRVRPHGRLALVQAEGVDTLEAAERLRGRVLYLAREDVNLGSRWFVQDLIGLRVFDADSGAPLGAITDVSATGANDVWHIDHFGREALIPAVPDVIVSVDLDEGEVRIRPMKGLFDDGR